MEWFGKLRKLKKNEKIEWNVMGEMCAKQGKKRITSLSILVQLAVYLLLLLLLFNAQAPYYSIIYSLTSLKARAPHVPTTCYSIQVRTFIIDSPTKIKTIKKKIQIYESTASVITYNYFHSIIKNLLLLLLF